jgi:hypothetical protein
MFWVALYMQVLSPQPLRQPCREKNLHRYTTVFGGLKTARKGSRKTARYHYLHLDKRQPLQSNPTSPTPTSCGSAPPSLPSSPVQDQDASLLDLLKDTSDPFLAFNPTRYILDPALEAPTKEEKRHPMEINQPVLGWEMEEEELFDISRQEELRWIEELNSVWAELYNTVKSLLEDESSNASSFSSMGAVFVQFWREEFEHKGLRRLLDTSWGRSILLMTEQNELASLMGSNIPLNTLRYAVTAFSNSLTNVAWFKNITNYVNNQAVACYYSNIGKGSS